MGDKVAEYNFIVGVVTKEGLAGPFIRYDSNSDLKGHFPTTQLLPGQHPTLLIYDMKAEALWALIQLVPS